MLVRRINYVARITTISYSLIMLWIIGTSFDTFSPVVTTATKNLYLKHYPMQVTVSNLETTFQAILLLHVSYQFRNVRILTIIEDVEKEVSDELKINSKLKLSILLIIPPHTHTQFGNYWLLPPIPRSLMGNFPHPLPTFVTVTLQFFQKYSSTSIMLECR